MGNDIADVTWSYAPEYGPIRRLFEYVLFYAVVDRLTELLVALLEEVPPLASHARTLQVASAVSLVVVLVVVVLWEARRQYVANPVETSDLAALRPSPHGVAVAGAALAIGAAVVAAGWEQVVAFTGDTEVLLAVTLETMTAVSSASGPFATALAVLATDLGVLSAFIVGVVLLAYGVDRLLIGLAREVLYRRHAAAS